MNHSDNQWSLMLWILNISSKRNTDYKDFGSFLLFWGSYVFDWFVFRLRLMRWVIIALVFDMAWWFDWYNNSPPQTLNKTAQKSPLFRFFHFHTFKSIIFKNNITFSVKLGFYIFTVIIYYALLNYDLIILESFGFIFDVHFFN